MTGFAKTDLMGTNTEMHFLCVDESHTHALSKDTKHLRLDGRSTFTGGFFLTLSNHKVAFYPVWPLRGINKTAWGAKLILMADLALRVSCATLNHLLMALHCHLCLSACFSSLTASHLPPPPTLSPSYLPTPHRLNQ